MSAFVPYHENIRLLLLALHGYTKFSCNYHDFVAQIPCNETLSPIKCKNCIYTDSV